MGAEPALARTMSTKSVKPPDDYRLGQSYPRSGGKCLQFLVEGRRIGTVERQGLLGEIEDLVRVRRVARPSRVSGEAEPIVTVGPYERRALDAVRPAEVRRPAVDLEYSKWPGMHAATVTRA